MVSIKQYLGSGGVVFVPAVVCYLVKDGKVLLGRRKEVSLGLGKGLISGIGGKVGDKPEFADETYEQALVRELREEIGVAARRWRKVGQIRFLFPHKPKWNQEVTAYIVEDWEGEPQETDAIQPLWFDLGQLPAEKMWHDNQFWVPRVLAGESVQATFLYGGDGKVWEYYFE